MSARTEASEQDDESAEEQQNHRGKQGPDRDAEFRRRATRILAAAIDVILDDAEEREIGREHDDAERPGQGGEERGE
jgi:hypothetical protein